ncbi:hypothetical protein FRB94_010902 [Tulasnella sp. JGI-2019a]|nr:hypothetical protein FRB94_010902 [Tulasnella sp. JGI-2019a]
MTSHLIQTLARRAAKHNEINGATPIDADCTFCRIIHHREPAFKVFENDHVLAILDILPIRQGHILVIPKEHVSRVSDLSEALAAELGKIVSRIANALTKALNNGGLNIVCNQEYAQVHFHIVPAPVLSGQEAPIVVPTGPEHSGAMSEAGITYRSMLKAEFLQRDELDDEQGEYLITIIKAKL